MAKDWEDAPSADGWEDAPSQSGFDLGTALKSSFANVGNTADTALSTLAGSAAAIFGDEKSAIDIEEQMKQRRASREQWANPTQRKLSAAEKIAGGLATLPLQIAGSGLEAADTTYKALEAGETAGRARTAGAIDAAGNVLGMVIPGFKEGSLAVRAATGFGANAAQDVATKAAIQQVVETDKAKQMFAPTLEDALVSGVVGGTMAGLAGKGKKPTKPSPGSKADLALAKEQAKKEAAKVGPEIEAQVAKMHDASILEKLQKLDQDLTTQERRAASEGTVRAADETLYADPQGQVFRGNPAEPDPRLGLERQTEAMDVALDTNTLRPDGEPLNLLQTEQLRAANEGPQFPSREQLRETYQKIELARKRFTEEFDRTKAIPDERGEGGPRPMGFGNKGSSEGVGTAPKMQGLTGAGWRRKQGGGINPEVFKEGFQRLKQLADGTILRAYYNSGSLTVEATKDGKKVGGAIYEPTDKYAAPSQTDLAATMVGSKQRGLATEVYKFTSELGNDIVPSKVRTKEGSAMWEGFERKGLAQNGKIPFNYKKQGGGILFDFGKKKELDVLKNNKHLSDVLPELTTVADTPEGVLALTKAAKDVDRSKMGKVVGNFTKGMLYEKFKTDHPLVKYTYDKISNAIDTAQYRFDTLVNKDIAPALRAMSKQEKAELGELLLKEMKAKKDIPPNILKESGFSDAQISMHQKIRDLHKTNLDTLNVARKAAGKPPIDAYTAYIAGLSSGNFRKTIYKWATDAEGNVRVDETGAKIPEVVGIVGSDFRGLMNKRIEAILAKHPEWMASDEKYTGMRKKGETDSKAMVEAMSIVSDNNPNFKEFSKAMEEIIHSDVYDALGAKRHTMSKKGVFGMEGDQPWKDSYENAVDLFNAQIRYTDTMGHWAELSKAMDDLSVILKDPEVQEKHPNAVKMVKDYTSAAMGQNPSIVGNALDNLLGAVGDVTGIGPNVVNKGVALGRQALNSLFFSLNHAWMAVNVFQPLMVSPEMKAFLKARGVDVSLDPTGITDLATKGSWSSFKHVTGFPETPFEKSMWKYAKEHGMDQSQLIETTHAVERDAGFMINKALKFGANQVEVKPRGIMFGTFAHMLKDAGYKMDADLFKVARELTDMAMADYRHHEQMKVLNNLGPAQGLAANLTSFKQNTLSRYALFAREMGEGNYRAFMTAAITALTLSGIMGLPGYSEMNEMVEILSKKMGKPTTLDKIILDLADNVNEKYKGVGDVFAMGAGAYAGVDLHNRIGMPEAMPTLTGGAGKFVDVGKAAGTFAKKPNEWNAKQLARQVNPVSPLNIWMDNTWFTNVTDSGEEIALNRKGQGTIIRDDKDKLFKKWGFTGSNESKLKAKEYTRDVQDMYYQDKQKNVREQVLEVIASNGGKLPAPQANALSQAYIEAQGNPNNWDTVVKEAEKTYNTTKFQRRIEKNKGNTPSSAYKLKRAVE